MPNVDPELQLIYDSLNILLMDESLKKELGSDEFYAFTDQVEGMKERYAAAQKLAKSEKATAEQRRYAKDLCDSIAKGLPVMTKAAISAAQAFRKGDPITGSAAIMDMCAAVAPILGSILSAGTLLGAAGGPVGMLAGALFSIIGQIVMLFAPKGDSMLDQIEKILKDLEQETLLVDIKSVQDEITAYTRSLRRQARILRDALKKPLNNHDEFLVFDRELVKMQEVLKADNPHGSIGMFTTWRVKNWLELDTKQEMDRWPEVLGIFCKAYTDLVTASMTISLLCNSDDLRKKMTEVGPDSPHQLSDRDKEHIETELNHLLAYAEQRADAYASCNESVVGFIRKIRPVARDRGLFFVKLDDGHVFAGTGKNVIQKDMWGQEIWNYCKRISITVSKEDQNPLSAPLYPQYHFWALEDWHEFGTDAIWHGRLDSRKLADRSANRSLIVHREPGRGGAIEFSDIWALSSSKRSYVYCSRGNPERSGGVQTYQFEDGEFTDLGSKPGGKLPLLRVRAITPTKVLDADPDKDAMPASLLAGKDYENSIVYGLLKGSPDVYVNRMNETSYLPAPSFGGNLTGIAVDPYFLWVFGPRGCACATHASIMSALARKRDGPLWLETPSFADILWEGEQFFPQGGQMENFWTNTDERKYPEVKGLVDVCPSYDDGTLFLSGHTRTVKRREGLDHWEFTASDKRGLWAAAYQPNFEQKKITTGPWTKFAGGTGAAQVQKLPIPCWHLLNSLEADLGNTLETHVRRARA